MSNKEALNRALAETVCRAASAKGIRVKACRIGLMRYWIEWHFASGARLAGPECFTPKGALVEACRALERTGIFTV